MTNVHDRTNKWIDNAHAKAGHNAALRGALLAFAKPPLISQNSQHTSRPSSVIAPVSVTRRNDTDQERRSWTPTISSQYFPEQDRAQNNFRNPRDETRSGQYNHARTKSERSSLFIPATHDRPRSKSPSSIAASLAVLRHSPQYIERPVSTIRGDTPKWNSSMNDQSVARIVTHNTAGQVKSWLDHVDGASGVQDPNHHQHLQRAATGPASYSFTQQTVLPSQDLLSVPKHINPTYNSTRDNYETEEVRSDFKLPRSTRASTRKASFESATLLSSSEISTSDGMYETGHDIRNRVSRNEQDFQNTRQLLVREGANNEFSASEVDGTADEDEQLDENWNRETNIFRMDTIRTQYQRPSSSMTIRPIPSPQPKLRPPPSLRPAMDARRKLENAKRGFHHAVAGWQPSAAHDPDSLANAMVASSLAASRAPSPVKATASPLTRKHTDHSHLQIAHLRIGRRGNRSPSPLRTMPHTLRKAKSSSDEEDHKDKGRIRRVKRGLHIHKHPHKHNEGNRKRWRDEITPRERKRYEGLWGANRGLLIEVEPGTTLNPLNSHISNIIVRDIWTRSRLPDNVLEEVWELVDRERSGKLTKEEFVVGMWLVDQRLKGRKLPAKVGQSVWRSARGLYGLKVPKLKD